MAGFAAQSSKVNGRPGVIITVQGRPFAILGFAIPGARIVEINRIADLE